MVPHSNRVIIDFLCDWIEQYHENPEITLGWERQKPLSLTEWETANLTPIVGIELINLLKSASFIGCQLMMNAIATYIGHVIIVMDEIQIQTYFGVFREYSEEEDKAVQLKYPLPF